MSEKLEFDLLVGKNDLTKELDKNASRASDLNNYLSGIPNLTKKASDSMKELGNQTSFASDFMGQFKSQALGVAAGQFAFELINKAISSLTSSIEESVKAFTEQEDAINKLDQSFAATGSTSEDTKNSILEFANEIQRTSKFADEAIVSQVAFVKSLGATSETAKNLVLAATNLSSTLGGSLEENVQKLGITLTGTAGRLSRYIPELKSLTQEQLKAGDAADIINKKFAGAAANDLKTYSGSVANTKNAFNDLQEEIGKLIAKNTVTTTSMSIARDIFASLAEKIGLVNKAIIDNDTKKIGQDATNSALDIARLNKEITAVQVALKSSRNRTIFDDEEESAVSLELQLNKLIAQRSRLEEQQPFKKDRAQQVKEVPLDTRTKEEVEAERVKQEEITSIQASAILERGNQIEALKIEQAAKQNEIEAEQSAFSKGLSATTELDKIAIETERNLLELERIRIFETQKAELEAQLKLDKVNQNDTFANQQLEKDKINAEKSLAIQKINQDSDLKSEQKYNESSKQFRTKSREQELKDQETFLNTAATLSSSKNKELAIIGKAAAITQIAIKTPPAVASSFEFGTKLGGPPLGFAFGAIAATAMAAQAANIAGVQFESGGIVGATSGPDNRIATIRDGEMVLNANQQKKLFDMISSGQSSGDIIVQVDGREIARAVRSQVQGGFVLA